MACIINPTIENKRDLHNTIIKLRKSLRTDILKDNPNTKEEDILDTIDLVLKDNDIENKALSDEKGYMVYRRNLKGNTESSVDVYAIDKFKGGYKILYVTPSYKTAKVVRVASNGKTINAQYDMDNLIATEKKINENKTTVNTDANANEFNQTTISFGSSKKSTIEYTGDNIEIINAELINDISKSEEVLDELLKIDDTKLEPEHVALLRQTLRDINDINQKVIPDMVQHINKDIKGEQNYGKMILEGEKQGVYVGVTRGAQIAGNAMSAAETYVHEMKHASLEYAIQNSIDKIVDTMNDIKKVYELFLDEVTEEDFMPDINKSIDREKEREIAKARIAYLRDPNYGLNEFIVMSETNMVVKKVLEERVKTNTNREYGKGLWHTLIGLIQSLYDFVYLSYRKDTKNIDGAGAMTKYIKEISEVNNIAIDGIAKRNAMLQAISTGMDFMNKGISKHLISMINKFEKKIETKEGDDFIKELADFNKNHENYTKVQKIKFHMKMLARFLTNSSLASVGSFETWLELMSPRYLAPDGTVQQLIRVVRNSDPLETLVEKLGLLSNRVEYTVEKALAAQSAVVRELFDGDLSEEDSIALTYGVLNIELDSIVSEHFVGKNNSEEQQIEEMIEMLRDKNKLKEAIEESKRSIKFQAKNQKQATFMINQAVGLGEYMVTGESGSGQLMNSYNINGMASIDNITRQKLNLIDEMETSKFIKAEIDKLATMIALQKTDSIVKKRVLNQFDKNKTAVLGLMKYDKMIRRQFIKNDISSKNSHNIGRVKGYHEKINSTYITHKIALISDEAKMKKQNYILLDEGSLNKKYGLYLNTDYTEPGWRQEGVRMTNDGNKINSLLQAEKEHIIPEDTDMYDESNADMLKKFVDSKLIELSKEVTIEMKKMQSPNYKGKNKSGMRPVFAVGHKGEMFVTDMDVSVDKNKFENSMKTNNKVDAVLAKSYSRGIDLKYSKENNMLILDVIQKDMNENFDDSKEYYDGGTTNAMSYVKIGPSENNKISKEIWQVLPRYMKVEIINRHKKDYDRHVANTAKKIGIPTDKLWTDEATKIKNKLDIMEKSEVASIEGTLVVQKRLNKELSKNMFTYLNKMKDSKRKKEIHEELAKFDKKKPYIAVRRNLVYHYFGNRETSILDYTDNKNLNVVIKVIKQIDMIWKHIVKIIKTNIVIRDLPVLMLNILSNVLLAALQGRNPVTEIKQQITGITNLHKYKLDVQRQQQLKIKLASGTFSKGDKVEHDRLQNDIRTNPARPLVEAGLYTSATEDLSNDELHKETYMDVQEEKYLGKLPNGVRSALDVMYLTKNTTAFRTLLLAMQYSDFGARYSKYYRLLEEGKSPEVATKLVLDNQINYGFGSGKLIQWANARGLVLFTKFFEAIQRVVKNTTIENPFNVLLAVIGGGFMIDDSPLGDTVFTRNLTGMLNSPAGILGILTERPALAQILTGKYN